MSVEFESGKRIAQLIKAANAKTGKTDTDLTAAVQSLVDSAGGGDTEAAYVQGKADERTAFWEEFQQGGKRTDYSYAFRSSNWNDKTYNPLYPLENANISNAFAGTGITDTRVPFTLSTAAQPNIFMNAANLKTVRSLVFSEGTTVSNWFMSCIALENLNIDGSVISTNGFSVRWSSKLTRDSLLSIIGALRDYSEDTSGTTWKVTIGATNYSKLTEEEIKQASAKGWLIE